MTGHSSHFKVVHNKHASSSSSSSSSKRSPSLSSNLKRRLPSSDSDLTSRESDDILDVEASLGPLEVGLEIENDGSVEVEVKVGDVKAEVEVGPRDTKEGVLKKRADATPSDACDTGAFYTAPTIGSTHDSLKPLTVSWDPALNCLSSTLLDIYLYAPHSTSPRIHLWSRVKVARGKMDVEIMPRWWNATSSEELQIQIVESGKPPFLSNLPAGPVFTATYEAPTDGTTLTVADTSVVDIGETRVNDDIKASSSKGKIAAGILVPLLFIAIGLAFFLRWKRAKSLADRKKWTEAVDKRMSTISTDWKSVTGKGAQEAIRKSFAAGNRASTFSFNGGGGVGVGGRPSSQWANDEWNEKGGAGDGDLGAQKRPGVGLRNPASLSGTGERVSRVSFADGPRPSSESRRTKVMRDSYVPPVPSLPTVATPDTSYTSSGYGGERDGSEEGTGSGAMSPTQTQGAFSLTPEAIRARIAAGRARSGSNASAGTGGMGGGGQVKGSVDIGGEETLAALSMMRTGAAGASTDDLLFAAPAAPPQVYSSPLAGNSVVASPIASSYNTTAPLNLHGQSYSSNGMSSPTVSSPVMSSIPMQAMPAAVMSPDDMLRAYAERKKSMSAVPASHGSSSSLSQSTYGASSAYNTYGTPSNVAYPAMPAPTAASGRTLFNGNTVSPQHSGEKKERTPSLGFAPGEYDPNFTFQQEEQDAYGGMDGGNGNAAGRGAWRS